MPVEVLRILLLSSWLLTKLLKKINKDSYVKLMYCLVVFAYTFSWDLDWQYKKQNKKNP